jgi:hypothetical protein
MDEPAALGAVEPGVAVDRRGVVELEDEPEIGAVSLCSLLGCLGAFSGELAGLPELPFVLAEILDDERAHVWYLEEALAGGVDGEAAQVAGDPAAAKLLGDGGGGAGADESVED